MKNLVVLTAGLSNPSTTRLLADQISAAVRSQVGKRGEGLEVEFVEIREYAQDLANFMTSHVPSAHLQAAQEKISAADALVAVTPVFSASYSGLFKMFIDALSPDSLNGMPVLIAATAGTARHQLVLDFAMRPLFTYLRATVMPTGVFAATEDFGGGDGGQGMVPRVKRAASELAGYIVRTEGEVAGLGPAEYRDGALKRDAGTRVQSGGLDFASMLKGHTGE